MTRHPDSYDGVGKPVFGDVDEPGSLRSAMAGADAAYYLVHSLQQTTSSRRMRRPRAASGSAAAAAGWSGSSTSVVWAATIKTCLII